ncbi:MAG: hypothetical protein HYZ53_03850 [Planctomycetes bacterium]|nr:hypothetical protein [Planctomycetota bacterium]
MAVQLPQREDVDGRRQRNRELELRRAEYAFVYASGLPPFLATLPKAESEGGAHKLAMYADLAGTVTNLGLGGFRELLDVRAHNSLVKFDDLYPGREVPRVSKRWRTDEEFGRQRLAGVNPVLVERCRRLPENFPVTDADVRGLLPAGATLASEAERGRLYFLDYRILEGLPVKPGCYLPAAMCLLRVDEVGRLLPIAVQLGQTPAAGPIFTPKDPPWLWLAAKTYVQVADASYHEMASHLQRTHLVMEVFWVAARRRLSERHPVHELLAPHFWFTLVINNAARTQLLVPGGPIDKTMAPGYDGCVELVKRAFAQWTFERFDLRADLRARGVDDVGTLPGYHYRDDALRVWDAIQEFVTSFVRSFYRTPEDVAADGELQGWVRELTDPDACGLKGLPGNGVLRTQAEVVQLLTQVLFTASAEHASVNNGQFDYFGYVPNTPGSLQMPPPRTKAELTELDLVKTLPTFLRASEQIAMVHMLSQPTEQPLGAYSENFFAGHPQVREFAAAFRARLASVSAVIAERNRGLAVPYTYLDPRQISQSIAT